ncbi:MAG: hypothetical protein PHC92_04705 [Syntrophomonadaceae bacterium]|nr:hypothetical protein [Syntrophomonadaceae bacterium]
MIFNDTILFRDFLPVILLFAVLRCSSFALAMQGLKSKYLENYMERLRIVDNNNF